ncbi:MAG TPA: hypothetical protein PLP85_13640 [Alcaligenes sp.]|nr:hypothetical protein [Alcaligenes sp.]
MSSVRHDFYTLISTAVAPGTVIHSDHTDALPARPFIMLGLELGELGSGQRAPVRATGAGRVSFHRPVSIRLQYFGSGGFDVLDTLQLVLQNQAMQDLSEQLNITALRPVRLQVLSVPLEGGGQEPRAVLDLESGHTAFIEDDVGLIDTVEVGMNARAGEWVPKIFRAP